MMHCTIHYLAGGSFHDIRATVSISKPSFYRLVWHTIHCINRCEALDINLPKPKELNNVREGFQRISKDGVTNGCIGALDGYLMRITAPSFAECGNVGAYFSGHYCTYGVNAQAMCNANNSIAIRKTPLPALILSLPPGYFVAFDCAYVISEHMIAPYTGPQYYSERCDNFNNFFPPNSASTLKWHWSFGNEVAHTSHSDMLQVITSTSPAECSL